MPELFRAFGFSFFFFSREHEPIHIHVMGNDGVAKYVWDGRVFILQEVHNIKLGDRRKIEAMIDENSDLIIKRWEELFG
ncbi:DUF4160 domain-containing protein [Porphyromonas somerae]|uniref:DUF4160 domain-containing protein n=1 Tax=Porphyromonas somerae TaxID=322095 RepID=UPI002A75E774|nr:DUF4160 domain-containing protein [Porphyromonas somerae]MDY3120482.1 DUF4160 domain-containing protein [Porphyromonas somerae]MDY3884945.1 DUF4160 domain-containing protein [Porphyromonas somerae]MDY5815331.1 DUF4160 domain-containing protein [Porphyromonas somerae]